MAEPKTLPKTEAEIRAYTIGELKPLTTRIVIAEPDPAWPAAYEAEAARIRGALGARLRGTCDIVHAHGPRVAFWARTVADAAGAPFVVATLHELRWLSLPPGPRRWAWTALEAFANGRADRLTTSSSAALATARRTTW